MSASPADFGAEPGVGSDAEALPAGGSPSARVARGALAMLSTQPITWAASLFFATVPPRYLGDEGLGQYSAAMSVAGLATLVVTLGMPVYLRKRVAADPGRADRDVSGALMLITGLAVLVALALSLLLPLIGVLATQPLALQLALSGMAVNTIIAVLTARMVGQERMLGYAWLNAAGVVLTAVASAAVLLAGGGLVAFMAIELVMVIVMAAVTWGRSRFTFDRSALDWGLLRRLTHGGMPYFGWEVTRYVYGEVGRLLLLTFSRDAVIGWHAAAQKIVGIPVFVPVAIITPLFSALSRHSGDAHVVSRLLRRSVLAVCFLTVPLCAGIGALAPVIPDLLGWPAGFANSVPLLAIMSLLLPLVGVDMALGAALNALDLQRRWLSVGIVAAVFSTVASVLLIPLSERALGNGAIGTAVVSVATEGLMFVGALRLLPRGLLDLRTATKCLRVVVAGICLAVAVTVLRPVSLPLAVVASGLVYVAVVLATGALSAADLRALLDVVLVRFRARRP